MKKCLIKGCENHSDAGMFMGDLCMPCYEMLVTGHIHPSNCTFIGELNKEKEILRKQIQEVGVTNKDYIMLPNGCALFWMPNEVGGRRYASDEIGGGVIVWDTSLVDQSTLLAAIVQEENLRIKEIIEERKKKGLKY